MKVRILFILTFLIVVVTGRARMSVDKMIDDTSRNNAPKFSLELRFPYANLFYFHPDGEKSKVKAGFIGVGIGLTIHVNNKLNIGVFGRAVTDFPYPMLVPIEYFAGEHWFLSSKYLGITNSHTIKKWTLGYGLCFGENIWRYKVIRIEDKRKNYFIIGTILTAQYMPKKRFYIGATYRPSFLRPNIKSNLRYEHLVSIDFGWTFRLN